MTQPSPCLPTVRATAGGANVQCPISDKGTISNFSLGDPLGTIFNLKQRGKRVNDLKLSGMIGSISLDNIGGEDA